MKLLCMRQISRSQVRCVCLLGSRRCLAGWLHSQRLPPPFAPPPPLLLLLLLPPSPPVMSCHVICVCSLCCVLCPCRVTAGDSRLALSRLGRESEKRRDCAELLRLHVCLSVCLFVGPVRQSATRLSCTHTHTHTPTPKKNQSCDITQVLLVRAES